MKDFEKEYSGVLEVFVVTPLDLEILVSEENINNPTKDVVLIGIENWLGEFRTGGRFLCLSCDAEFSRQQPPFAFTVAVPFANPVAAVVAGVCERCSRSNLREAILRRYRDVIPDAYEIDRGSTQ